MSNIIEDILDNYIGPGNIIGDICTVQIKKLYPDAHLPTRGSAAAAGWDLYAYIPEGSIEIFPHGTVKIHTGLAMAIENGWEGEIRPRSGLATKKGARPANTPGTIDSDYRGEIIVALHNDTYDRIDIENGERIAQMLFNKVPTVYWQEVTELNDTVRGAGGFGSTGNK